MRLSQVLFLGAVFLTGCVPQEPQKDENKTEKTEKKGDSKRGTPDDPTRKNTFAPPAQTDGTQNPLVENATDSAARAKETFESIRAKLLKMKAGVEATEVGKKDVIETAQELRALVLVLQSDVDDLARSGHRMMVELQSVQSDYSAAASRFRGRIEQVEDQEFRKVLTGLVRDIEHAADDVPRRIELTAAFVLAMSESAEYLVEAEKCLADVVAMVRILNAGDVPKVTRVKAAELSNMIDTFLSTIERYTERAKPKTRPVPPVPVAPMPKIAPEPPPVVTMPVIHIEAEQRKAEVVLERQEPKAEEKEMSALTLPREEPKATAAPVPQESWNTTVLPKALARAVYSNGTFLCARCGKIERIPPEGVVLQ